MIKLSDYWSGFYTSVGAIGGVHRRRVVSEDYMIRHEDWVLAGGFKSSRKRVRATVLTIPKAQHIKPMRY